MPASRHQYYVVRLTTHVGPVVPFVLIGIAGLQLLSAVGYWLGVTPSANPTVSAILLSTAVIITILAGVIHYASRGERVDLAGICCVVAATVLCGACCIAAYVNDLGIVIALPYCVLVAVGATSFWLRRRHFVAGLIGSFTPPLMLLLATSPSAVEWSFSIQISGVTLAACTGMYLLVRKTNVRLFTLATELERRATYDALTGTLNRATWVDRAGQRLLAHQQQGRPTSCLFVDMDGFKQVNDTLGHEQGDGVLGQVAEVLTQFASADGLVGRLGGDEFVMLLPGTTAPQAEDMVRRIRTALYLRQHPAGRLAASIGIASSTGSDTLAQLVNRADLAMLEVKERSRQIRVIGEPSNLHERQHHPVASAAFQ